MKIILSIIVVTAAAMLPSVPASAQPCAAPHYEYCQIGCENLGDYTAIPAATLLQAVAIISSLTDTESHSAFIAQVPNQKEPYLVIHRMDLRTWYPSASEEGSGWMIESHRTPGVGIVAQALENGGHVFSTNSGHTVIATWRSCPAEPRKRSISR